MNKFVEDIKIHCGKDIKIEHHLKLQALVNYLKNDNYAILIRSSNCFLVPESSLDVSSEIYHNTILNFLYGYYADKTRYKKFIYVKMPNKENTIVVITKKRAEEFVKEQKHIDIKRLMKLKTFW